ncbi:phage head closure protein [Duganella sp. BJB476]|uniref:phage head closure protein n=1 Tax=Duganella sp. BJB476 TaxID=1871176 RepID=UPI000E34AB79|nr:phage head closure protein [Duganella sp. BJB476]RFP32421.1 head-tail adaptor protein [Duganella sp. BJB476]
MRAGNLRHRLTIQSRDTGVDVLNGQVMTWSNVATIWADIQPLSGREILAAAAVNTEISHVIQIRYQVQFANPKAMAAMRCLYGTRVFNISSARDIDEQHRTIELTCLEGMNDG